MPVALTEVDGVELGGALATVTESVRQQDVTQPVDGVVVESEAPSEPSVAPSKGEQPLSSPVVSSADAIERP